MARALHLAITPWEHSMASTQRESRHVLVVEDNPDDVRFIRKAFESLHADVDLDVVGNGEDALRYLRHEGKYTESPVPALVLLDLNLPLMSGRDVLAAAKSDPVLMLLPIIILSGSTNEDDIRKAYELHANSYVSKPMNVAAFREIARLIAEFWLDTASRPTP